VDKPTIATDNMTITARVDFSAFNKEQRTDLSLAEFKEEVGGSTCSMAFSSKGTWVLFHFHLINIIMIVSHSHRYTLKFELDIQFSLKIVSQDGDKVNLVIVTSANQKKPSRRPFKLIASLTHVAEETASFGKSVRTLQIRGPLAARFEKVGFIPVKRSL
jgi:hypothetical protein